MLALLILIAGVSAQAFEYDYQYSNYDEAEKAESFLRFDMKSTKLGLITTSFTGFAKDFKVVGGEDETQFKDVQVSLKTESLDTDIDGRNDKMWDLCLSSKEHPEIILKIPVVQKSPKETEAQATILVRGKEHPVTLKLKYIEDEIEGEAELSLKELEIPDPSIAVASVKDLVKLSFHLERPK